MTAPVQFNPSFQSAGLLPSISEGPSSAERVYKSSYVLSSPIAIPSPSTKKLNAQGGSNLDVKIVKDLDSKIYRPSMQGGPSQFNSTFHQYKAALLKKTAHLEPKNKTEEMGIFEFDFD